MKKPRFRVTDENRQCGELPEDRARDLWNLRLQLENFYEKTDLWPV